MNRVVAIVQARMSSARLPGKVLLPLAGEPVLGHVVARLGECRLVDQVAVATSTDPSDDPIAEFCDQRSTSCHRGPLEDVLARYVGAAEALGADWVVRITADCPAVDPAVVDAAVAGALAGGFDAYGLDGAFPDGLDCTVFKASALRSAHAEARLPSEREHVGPYILKRTDQFQVGALELFRGLSHHRWTLDEPADYAFLQALFEALPRGFKTADVLRLLEDRPELANINAGIRRNEGYERSRRTDPPLEATRSDLGAGTSRQFCEDGAWVPPGVAHAGAVDAGTPLGMAKPAVPAGTALYERAKQLIPGGTQLLSKRPELFAPQRWPAYYSRAKGTRVWDLDGREYTDMSTMAVGACILGYADEEVDAAVLEAIRKGVNSSLNCPEEVTLAEELMRLHPWFGMVRYARGGGEAMAMAVRIARAHTRRDTVLFSGYHGWSDWYLAANLSDNAALDGQLMPGLEPRGVPRGLSGTARSFTVGDPASLREAVRGREKDIAAIIIEPARGHEAPQEHLMALRDVAHELGAVLIFDEITSGFRMCAGGIHRRYGVHPDVAVFAKSMANGYAMAAVLGKEEVMQAAQSTFISSTNWTERVGPAAALATLAKYEREHTADHICALGSRCKEIWLRQAAAAGLHITVSGLPSLAGFSFAAHGATAQAEGAARGHGAPAQPVDAAQARATRFVIEMLDRGFLGFRQFKPSLAHTMGDLARYETAVAQAFGAIAAASPEDLLQTPVAHSGFHRLTGE